jgi:DNA-binding MarR family transcriptional regulator
MGWFFDLVKNIPVNAVLREKLAIAEEKYAALKTESETENTMLKTESATSKTENVRLQSLVDQQSQKIKELEQRIHDLSKSHIKAAELRILQVLYHSSQGLTASDIASHTDEPIEDVTMRLGRLSSSDLVWFSVSMGPELTTYSITQDGRELVAKSRGI